MTLIDTPSGTFEEIDLVRKVEVTDDANSIGVAIEWIYVGTDPKLQEYVGKQVRRDVWVTIKHGHAAVGQLGG